MWYQQYQTYPDLVQSWAACHMPFSTLRHPLLIILVYSFVWILTFIISQETQEHKTNISCMH